MGRCESSLVHCQGSGNHFESESKCQDTCGKHKDATCLDQLASAKAMESKGLLGVFHPRCTEDGGWKSLQCQSGVYGCWCVDHFGSPFSGTSHGVLNPGVDGVNDGDEVCADLRHSCAGCERPQQERCTVQHQADGVNCALGACVEAATTKALV